MTLTFDEAAMPRLSMVALSHIGKLLPVKKKPASEKTEVTK